MNTKLITLIALASALCVFAASDAMAYKRNGETESWKNPPTELAGGYGRLQPKHGGDVSVKTADRKEPITIGYTNPTASEPNLSAQFLGMNYAGESTMAVDGIAAREQKSEEVRQ